MLWYLLSNYNRKNPRNTMIHTLQRIMFFTTLVVGLSSFILCSDSEPISLFNGKTFSGWEGDTAHTWRIENGAIIAGSLTETVPHNDFLCTETSYDDFVLRFKFKLLGTEGFVNAGVQFRSQRLDDPAYEMIGYQADIGPGLYGALYDESRRRKVLAEPDSLAGSKLVKPGRWNDYEIRAEGKRIRLFLNGEQTVDYTEPDATIPQEGLIGLQIHGDGKTIVMYKDLMLTEL